MQKTAVHHFAGIVLKRIPDEDWKFGKPMWALLARLETKRQIEIDPGSGLLLSADELSVADEMLAARKTIFQGQRVPDEERVKAIAGVAVLTAELRSGLRSPQSVDVLEGNHYARVSYIVPEWMPRRIDHVAGGPT